ncbi:MAG: undecaprenyldiphospho-muramoylpentapeptide beta-N-acetylglucosaminyltransferase [Minwuia sp.]|nr:undecaprenyldiphospho-muramoylpentapeptide beta-N-acetylglucosaminyltransferase [Minwuia sp.]
MSEVATLPPFVLTAGGTGGHLFPAQALAEELLRRGRDLVLITDLRASGLADRFPGIAVRVIRAAAPVGGLLHRARAALLLALGAMDARAILRALRPAAVVGFGGYASLPTVWMAQTMGIPTVLHEQNAHMGRANRRMSRGATALALSFPETRAAVGETVLVGNPVRSAVAAVGTSAYPAPEPRGDSAIRILVFGGSQGARIFSDVVPGALADLPDALRPRLHVTQQARPEDLGRVRSAYADAGMTATVDTFFDDMPALLAESHLVIARSGASTVTELAAAGRPAILVPYPHAADDHQTANAEAARACGAAWTIPNDRFDQGACTRSIMALLEDPAALSRMAIAARASARLNAASDMADLVEQVGDRNANGVPHP